MSDNNLRNYINIVEATLVRTEPERFPEIPRGGTVGGVNPVDISKNAPEQPRTSMYSRLTGQPQTTEPAKRSWDKYPEPGQQAAKPRSTPKVGEKTPVEPAKRSAPKVSGQAAKPKGITPKTGGKVSKKTVGKVAAAGGAGAAARAASPKYNAGEYGYNSPDEIKSIQQMLVNMGYSMPVDGIWGPKTDSAYKTAYQQMYGSAPGGAQAAPAQEPASGQAVPDEWTKAKIAKQGQSADIAAAAGMPNPYLKESIDMDRIKHLINYKK